MTRRFRGVSYNIEILNPHRVSKGVQQVLVDGKEHGDNILPILTPGSTCQVTVVLGGKEKIKLSETRRKIITSHKTVAKLKVREGHVQEDNIDSSR